MWWRRGESFHYGVAPSSRREQQFPELLHLDYSSPSQSKKSNTEWCWTFLAGALGLELP